MQSCQFAGFRRVATSAFVGLAVLFANRVAAADGPREVATIDRPQDRGPAACSFEAPLCVHGGGEVGGEVVLRAVRAGEKALRTLEALGLPKPMNDDRRGGSGAFDVYLEPSRDLDAPAFAIDVDSLGSGLDRASAFAVIPTSPREPGCALEGAVARAIGFGAAMNLDAGMQKNEASLFASELEDLSDACPLELLEAVDDFQRDPSRALASGVAERADGAFLFSQMLDESYGRGSPGAVLAGLLAVSAQTTPASSFTFVTEPDLFDALRNNLRARKERLDKTLLDFAVARAFVGTRSDGAHLADAERFGDFGRVAFAWSLPASSFPRRVALPRPLEATGSAYVWIDLAGAPLSELTLEAEWETGALFRFALVKVDAQGAETARLEPAAINGATKLQATVEGLSGLAGLLVVAVNGGSIDRSHPYHASDESEPSGCVVRFER